MDLSDLNIVAIAPAPKAVPAKKKKNNKYERRRQLVEKAKMRQTEPKSRPKVTATNSERSENSQSAETSGDQSMATVENATKTTHVPVCPQKPLNKPPAVDDSNPPPVYEKKPEKETLRKVKPQTLEKKSGQGDETTIEHSSPPEKASRRRRPKEPSTDDQEHAKYMAEYHARPMELDRRSGARSKKTVSEASDHIFLKDHKDWGSLDLHPRLIQTLSSKFNLTQPTTVQSRTIQTIQDPGSSQKNVLIHSETGSGKTLAYLLPILQHLGFKDGLPHKIPRKNFGTKCIILCPTRELASQTLTVVEKLCQANFAGWMVPGGLLGGDSRNSEKARVRKGLGVLVATPGRLLDHLQKTESLLLNLKGKMQWLVLDEADRLLDMGLGDQVRQIVQLIRANEASKSQPWWRSVLVSATVTPSVQALAQERMLCGDQPWVWVRGGADSSGKKGKDKSGEETTKNDRVLESYTGDSNKEDGYSESTPRQLAQFHITVTAKLRLSTLISFLVQRVAKGERTVVFMGTCACVDFHHKLFESMDPIWVDDDNDKESDSKIGLFGNKAQVFKLHGNVQHSKRNQTLKLFDKVEGGAILLSTDVAARGLNLEGIDWAVQYDPPCEIADYIHRVGRVARAGKAGHSLLFLLPSEKGYLDVLQTKGVSKIEPLSLASTLNQAATLCTDWTNAGLKHGGNKEVNSRSKGYDSTKGSRHGEYFASEIQRRLEDCIVQENITTQQKWKEERKANKKRRKDAPNNKAKEGELMELARDAFMSFLRAYPTKREAAVRSIFSARALHVGHVARSFALKDPPKSLVSKHKQNQKATSEIEAMDQIANRPKSLQFEQYENNLVTLSDDEDGDRIDTENYEGSQRAPKRPRFMAGDNSKPKNAKALLLQNAMKMQNNLMDAM